MPKNDWFDVSTVLNLEASRNLQTQMFIFSPVLPTSILLHSVSMSERTEAVAECTILITEAVSGLEMVLILPHPMVVLHITRDP